MTDVFSVSSLEEYIKIVERFSPNFSLSRGQGSDLPLFPSALRRDQDGMRLYSKTTIQSFLEDFKFNSQMYIEGASTYHENDWLIHAQHFGVPTCLLDFTYSHLVSLMFALEKAFDYDQDDEDKVYIDIGSNNLAFDDVILKMKTCLIHSFLEDSSYSASSTNSREIEKLIDNFTI